MAYKRFRTADLIASSPKDAIDKRVVRLLKYDRTTRVRGRHNSRSEGQADRLVK